MHGRQRERTSVDALLTRVRRGHGAALALFGEPGIGKTALLDYAVQQASGMRVLRTAGVEPESELSYAALHAMLLPILDRVDALPAPQATALGTVFGRTVGPAPDRFLVGLAVLSLLSEVAGERPVLCVLDDAHWADAASTGTLAFVARRLHDEPIALAVAARSDEGRRLNLPGSTELVLGGLDEVAARALLAEASH